MSYSIIAIISLIMGLIVHYENIFEGDKDEVSSAYRNFLNSVITFYITDVFWGILYTPSSLPLCYLDTILYFIFMAFSVYYWTTFVIVYLGEEKKFKTTLHTLGMGFLIIQLVLISINVFMPIIFTFDTNGNYMALASRYIVLILQILIYVLTAVYVFYIYNHLNDNRRYVIIGLVSIVMAVFICLQTFYPLFPMYSLGCLFSTTILHTFVIENEKKEYREKLEKLILENRNNNKELSRSKDLIYTDILTGVMNRLAYLEKKDEIDNLIENSKINEFAVVVFDIDNLKQVNKAGGYSVGDLLIVNSCGLISRFFKTDSIYRIGGDEFVVILTGYSYNNRMMLVSEFNREMTKNSNMGEVVISCGMSEFKYGDMYFQDVFKRANNHMMERKNQFNG